MTIASDAVTCVSQMKRVGSATLIDWHRFGRSVSQSLPIHLQHGTRALCSFLFFQIWMIHDIDHWQLQMHGAWASYVENMTSLNTWNDWMPHEKMMERLPYLGELKRLVRSAAKKTQRPRTCTSIQQQREICQQSCRLATRMTRWQHTYIYT